MVSDLIAAEIGDVIDSISVIVWQQVRQWWSEGRIVSGLITSVIAVVGGAISSILVIGWQKWWQSRRDRENFGKLEGCYEMQGAEGTTLPDARVEIKREGNLLFTECCKQRWKGRLIMRRDLPEVGSGIYAYQDGKKSGIHEVQHDPQRDVLTVLQIDTSHVEGGKVSGGTKIWTKAKQ